MTRERLEEAVLSTHGEEKFLPVPALLMHRDMAQALLRVLDLADLADEYYAKFSGGYAVIPVDYVRAAIEGEK